MDELNHSPLPVPVAWLVAILLVAFADTSAAAADYRAEDAPELAETLSGAPREAGIQVADISMRVTVTGRTVVAVSFIGEAIPVPDEVWLGFLRDRDDDAPIWRRVPDLQASGAVVRIVGDRAIEIELMEPVESLRVVTGANDIYIEPALDESPGGIAFEAAKSTCQPQCTTYVATRTGITFERCWRDSNGWGKRFGDAGLWVAYARRCAFTTSNLPGSHAIMEFSSPAHVMLVTKSKLVAARPIVGSHAEVARYNVYELAVSDSNWNNDCKARSTTYWYRDGYAYRGYDARTRQPTGTKYRVTGFITRW